MPAAGNAGSVRRGFVFGAAVVGGLLWMGLRPPTVSLFSPTGPTGRTLKPGGTAGCVPCHGAIPFANMTTTISGPESLFPGQAAIYLITATKDGVANGTRMGIDVASSDAASLSVVSGQPTVLTSDEIVHSTTAGALWTTTSGSASYQFRYTMPADATPGSTHTLYGVAAIGFQGGWKHDADNFMVTTVAPPAPDTLTATPQSSSSIDLAWSGSTPEFRVVYKADSSPTSPTDGTLAYEGPDTSVTVSGLTPATAYFFAAYGKAGNSYSMSAATTSAFTDAIPTGGSVQVTANEDTERWSDRASSTTGGKILWTDGDDVLFYDGTAVSTAQDGGGLTGVADFVLTLGSGSAPGDVIGAWRRDTDFAWVWTRRADESTTLVEVTYENPFAPGEPMNPEAVAVADGCVFMVLQSFFNATAVKHVYRIDPDTGESTSLTGEAAVPGAARISTSGCQAAWAFDDGTSDLKLHYYDGASVTEVDSGALVGSPQIRAGRIVYTKTVGAVSQVFLYDTTAASPTPVALTTDSAGSNSTARTDGRHVAWIHVDADNVTRNVVLNGGVVLTSDSSTRPVAPFAENSLQLDRGQLLYADTTGTLRYYRNGGLAPVDISPATTFTRAWLADGYAAWLGTSSDGGSDPEVFRFTGIPPSDAAQPAAPLAVVATPGTGQVTVRWDGVLGATSYTLYLAEEPGVTKDNYASLRGGQRVTGVTSPYVLSGVTGHRSFSFVVATVEGAVEGPVSPTATATHVADIAWTPATGAPASSFHTVGADASDPSVAYAGGALNVYKTTDGGVSWTALGGLVAGQDVRAIAARGGIVFAVTRDGDIYRSTDAGGIWELVLDTEDLGEQVKAVVIDPDDPDTIYAANINLTGSFEPALVKSVDGGQSWVQLPSDSLRANSLALGPSGLVLAGGSGGPNVGLSTNGGVSFTSVSPTNGFIYSVALDRTRPWTFFAGLNDVSQDPLGIYKTTNAGATWTPRNGGLATPLSQVVCLLVDLVDPNLLHACSGAEYVYSVDGGLSWTAADAGLTAGPVSLAMTGSRQLLAATSQGLFHADLAAPPSISINGVTVAEGDSGAANAIFTVSLSAFSSQTVTVSYLTTNGTATAGSDYTLRSGTATFPPGTLSQTIAVPVIGDSTPEADETFFVNLSAPVNATLANAQGTGTIADDDGAPPSPRISISDRSVREAAAVNAAFLVTLSPATQQTVTVDYTTADGTAKAGPDYEATSGVLTFTPFRTTQTVFVPIVTDTTAEGTEVFFVNLSAPTNATIERGQAVGTIEDPPAPATIPMYRAYNRSTDYHFFTTSLASKNFAVDVLGFQDESNPIPFYVWNVGQPETVPLFRMYNPNLGRHYYTADEASRDFLISIGMVYELDEGFIYPAAGADGTTELFRLYNNNSGTHLFTADAAQKDGILAMFPGIWEQHTSVGYVFP